MITKTRRECIPAGSVAASLLLTVLVIMSVSYTKPSHMALGVAKIGTAPEPLVRAAAPVEEMRT